MKISHAFARIFVVLCLSVVESLGHTLTVASKANFIAAQNNTRYVQDILRLSKTAEIRSYMNESVDPCDNFYEFACGNWAKLNPGRARLETGKFLTLDAAYDRKIAAILKAPTSANETMCDKKVKEFYASCVKFDSHSANYRAKLREILREFGEMPAMSGGGEWHAEKFDWLETVAKISRKYGEDIIISAYIDTDHANSKTKRFFVTPPDFPLDKSIYVDDSNKEYYLKYVGEIKKLLKQQLGLEEKSAAELAHTIASFERKLATGTTDMRLGLDVSEVSSLLALDALQRKYAPTIDIKKYLNISWAELPQEAIYEKHAKYFQNLVHVLNSASNETIANYVFYKLLKVFKFETDGRPREQVCVRATKEHFDTYLENMVYRHYNIKSNEIYVLDMWQQLKRSFRATLLSDELDWITLQTRQYAIEKLDNIKLFINSYQAKNFTGELLGVVNISASDLMENLRNIHEASKQQAIAKTHAPVAVGEAVDGDSYTPMYSDDKLIIRIPVSFLLPYHFWADVYPNALKFSSLGSIIAHELIHGFDDGGRKYDKHGNLHGWWDAASAQEFVERTKCFTAQYRRYRYGGRYLPESIDQSENIADNGGLRLAYAAYQTWYAEAVVSGQSLRLEFLPGMQYSRQQLFFISFAQIWCSDKVENERVEQALSDNHTPDCFRAIGTLSNMAEFAKEFSCAAEAPMNPSKKCIIY